MSPQAVPKPDFMEQEAWDNLMGDAGCRHDPRNLEGTRQALSRARGRRRDVPNARRPTLLLGMTGRKSGNEVIAPVNYMEKAKT